MNRTALIVNSGAGTAMSMANADLNALLTERFGDLTPEIVAPSDFTDRLNAAFSSKDFDTVIVGGGDGSVSNAGRLALEHNKTLGVLPLGTMNLFARALGVPLELDEAAQALADARMHHVDIGLMNGTPFFNHISLGLHPNLIKVRDRMPRTGRLTKIANGARALLRVVHRTRRMPLRLSGDFEPFDIKAALTLVAVNPILGGPGQLPFRAGQSYGKFGVYFSSRSQAKDLLAMVAHLGLGRWGDRTHLDFRETRRVTIETNKRCYLSIDGEVHVETGPFHCEIKPGALSVLVPKTVGS